MGVALAEEARRRGGDVVLLSANLAVAAPPGIRVVDTPTAEAMLREALAHADADVVLMSAAVADYRPAEAGNGKRPKSTELWTVELEPTTDIVRELAALRENGQIIVAFGAEHGEAGLERKRAMLADKDVDLVVYNDVSRTDIGFDSKDNEVVLITRDGEKRVAKAPKPRIAAAVLDEAVALLQSGR
jgi:phosphopantothenoylcysteine decarboxylase/phosphopantothenate--cysteine ligase